MTLDRIILYLGLALSPVFLTSCDKTEPVIENSNLKFPEDGTYNFKFVGQYYDRNNNQLTVRHGNFYDPQSISEFTFDTKAKSVKLYFAYSDSGKEKIKQYYAKLIKESIDQLPPLSEEEYKREVESINRSYNGFLQVDTLPLYESRVYTISPDSKSITFFKHSPEISDDLPLSEKNLKIETTKEAIHLTFDYNQDQAGENIKQNFIYDAIDNLAAYRIKGYWQVVKKP
ncbi:MULTISPECIES: hypothetical protein [Sphingobacterium]|uniref:hypothetical protein n=1 Tax=Sphingobacterium TaxID=28453 RepID=UPI0013DD1ACA|nr:MULTISPECIES: hypothetical protein [unclassified Sphingobacterium]